MVFALAGDVLAHLSKLAVADRERGIGTLPFEATIRRDLAIDKMGRCPFQPFDQIGNRERGRQLDQKMNMVLDTTKFEERRTKLISLRLNRAIHRALDRLIQQRESIPGCPDQMEVDHHERLPQRPPTLLIDLVILS